MNSGKAIDLNREFRKFILKKAQAAKEPAQLEESAAELYTEWLHTGLKALGGATPAAYYAGASPEALVAEYVLYINADVEAPDVLLDAIVDAHAEDALYRLLTNEAGTFGDERKRARAKVGAVELLHQIGSVKPAELYVQIILAGECEQLACRAAEALAAIGEEALPALKRALKTANGPSAIVLLDILTNIDTGAETFELVAAHSPQEELALYAAILSRFFGEAPVSLLYNLLRMPLGYLDYIAVRNALEALGEEVEERDFSGDPEYENMKLMWS